VQTRLIVVLDESETTHPGLVQPHAEFLAGAVVLDVGAFPKLVVALDTATSAMRINCQFWVGDDGGIM